MAVRALAYEVTYWAIFSMTGLAIDSAGSKMVEINRFPAPARDMAGRALNIKMATGLVRRVAGFAVQQTTCSVVDEHFVPGDRDVAGRALPFEVVGGSFGQVAARTINRIYCETTGRKSPSVGVVGR